MKTFYIQHNVGNCKYVVNFHDGIKLHKDGSPFFDITIFNNKTRLDNFTKTLLKTGFKETNSLSS